LFAVFWKQNEWKLWEIDGSTDALKLLACSVASFLASHLELIPCVEKFFAVFLELELCSKHLLVQFKQYDVM
jgi:hypothetical protein